MINHSVTCPPIEFSVVMPCLNECKTLQTCINKAHSFFRKNAISYEIIVADNGSTDGSGAIAIESGAILVNALEKGYGNALKKGIEGCSGKYIIMGDADDSYDFSNLKLFVDNLRNGYQLVMGNRFKGTILPGAMPWHHQYIGNPVLSFIGRCLFTNQVKDYHCGLRGFTKELYMNILPIAEGMEFASEFIIKAALYKASMCEIPIILFPDGRGRKAHLRSWNDGCRHLKLLILSYINKRRICNQFVSY